MCKITCFLVATVFVFAVICLLPMLSKAQEVPNYLFLEVIDSSRKPVADATVEIPSRSSQPLQTYSDGKAQFPFPYDVRDFTNSFFKVSKIGYFSFQDLGLMPSGYQTHGRLELLKIPQTEEERKILGSEQLKREFLWAAKSGDATSVRKLLRAGANPNLNTNDLRGVPAPKNVPAIIFAAASGDRDTVAELLKAGVNVRVKTEPVRSVLAYYLRADPFKNHKPENEAKKARILKIYEDGAEMLVKAGADINVLGNYGQTTLMTAAGGGYRRIVKLLLDKGLPVNSADNQGRTVLMYAADDYPIGKGKSKIGAVNLLLERGADPNSVAANGDYCTSALMLAASAGGVDIIRALLKSGAKVNHSCKNSEPALQWAINGGHAPAVRALIDAGADINFLGYAGKTVLMRAAENDSAEVIQVLIEKGAPINAKDHLGRTALIHAIESYRFGLAKVNALLNAGANPNTVSGNVDNQNWCSTSLMSAARKSDLDILRALIAKRADVKFTCQNGDSALNAALSGENSLAAVKLLLENGADAAGKQGRFALARAKSEQDRIRNSQEIIKILEAAGAK